MSKIRASKKSYLMPKNVKLMSITQISQYLTNLNIEFQKFLSLMFQGKIKPCHEDIAVKGVHRFLFSEDDIKASIRRFHKRFR